MAELAPAAGGSTEAEAPRRVDIALGRDVSLWQVRLWPDRFAAGSARLGAALRAALPPPGASTPGPCGRLIRAAPLTWRLLDAPAEADGGPPAALRLLEPGDGALVDLGPGMARIDLTGPAASDLLARAVSLDLRPAAFQPGGTATTGWRGADVTVLRLESGGWRLLVPQSCAEDMAEVLARHAAQFA